MTQAGFRTDRQTLFVWEGVTFYLSSAVVDATLSRIRACAPAGSVLSFDYAALSPATLNEERSRRLHANMRANHAAEPARFGILAGTIESFLAARGYRLVEHLDAGDMERRFLTLRDGSSLGRPPALLCLARAELAG